MPRVFIAILLLLETSVIAFSQGATPQHVIWMGTLAPKNSRWHQILIEMGEQWKKISGGKVELKIYPGGEQGDEPSMIQKMRIKKLQSVAISGAGLADIEAGINALQTPMLIQSYEELDYVRDRIAPDLEKRLAAKGFVVLNWGDTGWVHYFSKKPAARLSDFRKLKLCVIAGDNRTFDIYKANGFKPETLAATDILSGLKTGLIEAFAAPPLIALGNQWFGAAPNMLDVKWAPLIGATIISKETWNQIPAGLRAEMLKVAQTAGEGLRGEIRQLNDKAVSGMQAVGMNVVHADAGVVAEWQKMAEGLYPSIRGKVVPPDVFDRVRKLRDDYRAAHPATSPATQP